MRPDNNLSFPGYEEFLENYYL